MSARSQAQPRPINDERRQGARFTIEITEGPMQGRRVSIELITGLRSAVTAPDYLATFRR